MTANLVSIKTKGSRREVVVENYSETVPLYMSRDRYDKYLEEGNGIVYEYKLCPSCGRFYHSGLLNGKCRC